MTRLFNVWLNNGKISEAGRVSCIGAKGEEERTELFVRPEDEMVGKKDIQAT